MAWLTSAPQRVTTLLPALGVPGARYVMVKTSETPAEKFARPPEGEPFNLSFIHCFNVNNPSSVDTSIVAISSILLLMPER